MNIKRFLDSIFIAIMLLWGEDASAQKLIKIRVDNFSTYGLPYEAIGCWVLDCSDIESYRLSPYKDIALRSDLYNHDEKSSVNRVSKKLLILNETADNQSWWTAQNISNDYSKAGYSNWRLPTQRELALLWAMGLYTSGKYWSATKNSEYNGGAWLVDFSKGLVHAATTGFDYSCFPVHELP